jgi:hypothetical protein
MFVLPPLQRNSLAFYSVSVRISLKWGKSKHSLAWSKCGFKYIVLNVDYKRIVISTTSFSDQKENEDINVIRVILFRNIILTM